MDFSLELIKEIARPSPTKIVLPVIDGIMASSNWLVGEDNIIPVEV